MSLKEMCKRISCRIRKSELVRVVRKANEEGVLLSKTVRFIFLKLPKKILCWLVYYGKYLHAMLIRTNSNKIMFVTHNGTYSCNPKYICEELRRRNLTYELIFSASPLALEDEGEFPEDITIVEQSSEGYWRGLNEAKVVVVNSVEFTEAPIPAKKDRILIQTWHGSLGIKHYGPQHNPSGRWIRFGEKSARLTNFLISNSSFEEYLYRDTFWVKTPVLRYGHPRNDLLFRRDTHVQQEIRARIEARYSVKLAQRIVLYAPTFRENGEPEGGYIEDFERLKRALADRFDGQWDVLVRFHPMEQNRELVQCGGVIDVTSYPDMQELLLISDVGITDYSSWIYDFMLLKRPGFLFAADRKNYERERGLYFPLESTPFPIAEDLEALERNIRGFEEEPYQRMVEAFLVEKGCMEDGKAAQRTVDKIIELMERD